jgi:hypothetical protein
MPIISSIREYPDIDIEKFWKLVGETLYRVFKTPYDRIERVRGWINERPDQEQLLFYHSEPLDVAADIARERPGRVEIDRYREIAKEHGWLTN